jgi:hypothetical protein
MGSTKTQVIEAVFDRLWDAKSKSLSETVVDFHHLDDAIKKVNKTAARKLSLDNKANFFKDIIRNDNADSYWPPSVLARGYTARQVTGKKAVFEFVALPTGQSVPFPNVYLPSASTPTFRVQTVSMSIASKTLGRRDETWMTQVLVRLNVIPTHFALASPRKIIHVDHLQMGVKRKSSEIDAIFLGVEETTADLEQVMITFEAKQIGERIIEEQVTRQVTEAFAMSTKQKKVPFDAVIPLAIKNLGGSQLYLIEFEKVARGVWPGAPIKKATDAIYELVPSVPGI